MKHSSATSITQILFNKDDQNIILPIYVNYSTNGMINYRNIHDIIAIHNTNKPDDKDNIDFENQKNGSISIQLKKIIMDIIQRELNLVKTAT